MALLQVVPWLATGLADPVPQFGANLFKSLLLALPLSYLVGGPAAAIAGLALAAYFAWGGRITWWACLAASLIYPAVLAANSMVQAISHSESVTSRADVRTLHRDPFRLLGARLLLPVAQHQAGAKLRQLGRQAVEIGRNLDVGDNVTVGGGSAGDVKH